MLGCLADFQDDMVPLVSRRKRGSLLNVLFLLFLHFLSVAQLFCRMCSLFTPQISMLPILKKNRLW